MASINPWLAPKRGSSKMQIEILSLHNFSKDDQIRYELFRKSNLDLDSPYFDLNTLICMGRAVPSGYLARFIIHDEVVGYFPFQQRGRFLQPLGMPFADYCAPVMKKGVLPDWDGLLKVMGAEVFELENLVSGLSSNLSPKIHHRHICDIETSFDNWLAQKRAADKKFYKNLERCERNIIRDFGEVRLDIRPATYDLIEWVISRKRQQYRQSGFHDVFACGWPREIMRHLGKMTKPFEGAASQGLYAAMLYAGDRLMAVEISLIGNQVLHFWFPAYDPEFARYSPGFLLSLKTMEALSQKGIKRFDLGAGDEGYKSTMSDPGPEVYEIILKKAKGAHVTRSRIKLVETFHHRLRVIRGCETGPIGIWRAGVSLIYRLSIALKVSSWRGANS